MGWVDWARWRIACCHVALVVLVGAGCGSTEHAGDLGGRPGDGRVGTIKEAVTSGGYTLTPFEPNTAKGGRAVSVDFSASNPNIGLVAAETGGVFRTMDGGSTWTHLDSTTLPFTINDVRIHPTNANVYVATVQTGTRSMNEGGIWFTLSAGSGWRQAAPQPTCVPRPSAYGIAFAPDNGTVYVGTDCGVAISQDAGHYSYVAPNPQSPAVYSVAAQANGIVDVYGADGHHRSTDGGKTWTAHNAALPGVNPMYSSNPQTHELAASPISPNVLFAAAVTPGQSAVFESDDGGQTWNNVFQTPADNARPAFIKAHASHDGNPSHVDVWFHDQFALRLQTCTATPCSGSFPQVNGATNNTEVADLTWPVASNACLVLTGGDQSLQQSSDCGASWQIVGGGASGYNAFQVYEVSGQVHPNQSDYYFGTQDEGDFASGDTGQTWPSGGGPDVYGIVTAHFAPSSSEPLMFHCNACFNGFSPVVGSGGPPPNWTNPPQPTVGFPFLLQPFGNSPGSFFVWTQGINTCPGCSVPALDSTYPFNKLYITSDSSTTWTNVIAANIAQPLLARTLVAGSSNATTLYQTVEKGARLGLQRIAGLLSPPVAVSAVDRCLGSVQLASWCGQQGDSSWACWASRPIVGVDPVNPQNLIVADAGPRRMMVSHDGGNSWSVDQALTDLVTSDVYSFDDQVQAIAFDQSNDQRILVGTAANGIIASIDGGQNWKTVPGSHLVPNVSSFFFDEVQQQVIISSYGRGLWKFTWPLCNDGIKDGDETDVDCGGSCTACALGRACATGADCQSKRCSSQSVCIAASCSDGIQDGDETGVDCGGSCAPCNQAPVGQSCHASSECQTGLCSANVCRAASCADGVKNGNETGVDCGGGTCPACPRGQPCSGNSDCLSGSGCLCGRCSSPGPLDVGMIVASEATGGSAACNGDPNEQCNPNTTPATGAAFNTTIQTASGSYTFSDWRDVLRVLLAGLDHNHPGTDAAAWAARDCNSDVRKAIANNYGAFFENQCSSPAGDATGGVCTQIRHVYRPDDFSEASDILVALLGLPSIVRPETTVNGTLQHTGASPFCNAVRPAFVFPAPAPTCLQGADASWDPTSLNTPAGCSRETAVYTAPMQDNDPIRRLCFGTGVGTRAAEDVCSHSGDLGLVLPMVDVQEANDGVLSDPLRYNANACALSHLNGGAPPPDVYDAITQAKLTCASGLLCPNGDVCNASGGCTVPADASGNSQCLSNKRTTPFATVSTQAVPVVNPVTASLNDGRSFNQHLYQQSGSQPTYASTTPNTPINVTGAYYRIHASHSLDPTSTQQTCRLASMNDQIGCLVQASPCSLGYASNSTQMGLKINNQNPAPNCVTTNWYPLQR
jgi:photosystem II stability/assembly factor-like uncharacterized protein